MEYQFYSKVLGELEPFLDQQMSFHHNYFPNPESLLDYELLQPRCPGPKCLKTGKKILKKINKNKNKKTYQMPASNKNSTCPYMESKTAGPFFISSSSWAHFDSNS